MQYIGGMKPLFLIAVLFLAACNTDPDADKIAACEASGGEWRIAGLMPEPACIPNYSDAGKTCEKATDCQGTCLADRNECSASWVFGCHSLRDETGDVLEICVD